MARKFTKYKQSIYHPINKDKYRGKYPIQLRSSYEIALAIWLDKHPSIIEWSSESVVIDYRDASRNNSVHRYYLDFTMTVRDNNNNITKYYIEVKPYKQTLPPKKTGRMKQKTFNDMCVTYKRNLSKWKAAEQYAKLKGGKFIILTEKQLFQYKK